MDTLWRVIERNALNYANETALRYPSGPRTYTWLDLYTEATQLAARLQSAGVRPGSTVALFSANKPEFVLGFLAATSLGAVIIPLNIRLTTREISGILADAEAEFFLFAEEFGPVASEIAGSGLHIFDLSAGLSIDSGSEMNTHSGAAGANPLSGSDPNSYPKARSGFDQSPGTTHFGSDSNPIPKTGHRTEPLQPAGSIPTSAGTAEILYTSGTTGKPKGVRLSHEAVLSVAKIITYEAGIHAGDNCLILMPLTHSAPLNLFLWGSFWAGATVTLGDFAPDVLLRYVSHEKPTHFFGAPIVYQLLSRTPNLKEWDLSSMKLWIYGGASVGGAQIQQWREALGGQWMGVYGLTEAGPNGSALRPYEHAAKSGSIGKRGTANTEIRVVRADGTDTAPDEAGEIIIRSESIMLEYHGNPEATREALVDGWLCTGDIARRDADGYIWILDRKKDMIISGGVNVYPKEIEDILSMHPQIADVAVIGVPHPDWGETVLAKVVLRPGEALAPEAIRDFCRDKLADYKIPRLVEIVGSLPRNASGKILKHVLRAGWSASVMY
ncbi:AMP-dependent synthetase/ligase [Acididesulfobacillus acetoxydans]|uniref:AMP-dependent synthetase/ligase n=1 Tax=Acididesulfobacillus acetoxydans TaxID=1561005 RepID=A0A8S0W3A0_9FIRM|nr:AMP-binding protein [Acididesulfobacillus acetoxydans]CAA7601458.1 AMP-dependent synthetase/ligase [Acididesulfobacillus acetoxydans]CEJ06113.1 Long-chain-fatty-acid--CoA ligase [Acididesulfobacillus acetoxydans]